MLSTNMFKGVSLLLAAATAVLAAPTSPITHLGSQGPILCKSGT